MGYKFSLLNETLISNSAKRFNYIIIIILCHQADSGNCSIFLNALQTLAKFSNQFNFMHFLDTKSAKNTFNYVLYKYSSNTQLGSLGWSSLPPPRPNPPKK